MIVGISGKIGSGKDTVGVIIQYLTFINDNLENEDYYSLPSFMSNLLCNKNAISEEFETQWKIKKFADKLKDMVCLLIGCTREQLEDQEFKEKELGPEWDRIISSDGNIHLPDDYPDLEYSKLTPRLLLQIIGTECIRDKVHPNAWVNALFADYLPAVTYQMEIIDLGASDLQREKIGKPIHDEYPNWIITDMRFPNELKAVKDRGGITIRVERFQQISKNVRLHGVGVPHKSETALDNAKFDYTIDNDGTIEDLIDKVKIILIEKNII